MRLFCQRQYPAQIIKPPNVTKNVAGNDAKTGLTPLKATGAPNSRPIAKHALIKPESKATKMPLGKLKSATAFFFSSSESEVLFIPPAMPIIVIPINVTITPIITADVSFSLCPVNTGPSKVPNPAQVPKAKD